MNRNQFSILETVATPEVKDYLLYRLIGDRCEPMRANHWFKDIASEIKEEVISNVLKLMEITPEDLQRFIDYNKVNEEAADDLYQHIMEMETLPEDVFGPVVNSTCLGHFLMMDGDDIKPDDDVYKVNTDSDWNIFLFNLFEDIVYALAIVDEEEDAELIAIAEERKDQPRIRVNINDLQSNNKVGIIGAHDLKAGGIPMDAMNMLMAHKVAEK